MAPTGDILTALFAIGMALSFLLADPRSPTSRALSATLGLASVGMFLNVPYEVYVFGRDPRVWSRLFATSETAALVAGFEWVLRVRRIGTATETERRRGERLLRVSQGLAILYGVTCLAVPQLRADYFSPSSRPGAVFWPQFYLFAVPLGLALGLAGVAIVQVFRTEPDPSEGLRLNAMALATPFLLTGFFAASRWRPVTTGIGEVVFLAGAIRYHVLQGQRGQFLARFLSPQVARLVRERGLPATMQQSRIQLSVVACDLRGFTPFAESAAPEEVMELLREYYDTIGAVVSAFGGTVKDLAGDGILCLVGAPIPYADHARRAVDMSLRMRERGGEVLSRWRAMGLDLGLGIGVASGYVTVGVLGGSERLEYAAVGPPVNLAARLCARAESGQILVDQRTVGLVGGSDRSRFERLAHEETLKGLSRPVVIHELTS